MKPSRVLAHASPALCADIAAEPAGGADFWHPDRASNAPPNKPTATLSNFDIRTSAQPARLIVKAIR
jgi:hypothetical protein